MIGALGFATPWLLAALVALPALWLILRAMPPAPRSVTFPGVALLLGLKDRTAEARRTPWWLLMLRCLAVAALILGLAGPVWNPQARDMGTAPRLVILDAGWQAAPGWPNRLARAERALREAAGRPAALLIADGTQAGALTFGSGEEAIPRLRAAQPAAWGTTLPDDPAAALANAPDRLDTLWITDGADHPKRAAWLTALAARGSVTVAPPQEPLRALTLTTGETPALTVETLGEAPAPTVIASGPDPQGIDRDLARLTAADPITENGVTRHTVPLDLPPELRNRVTRFRIEGTDSAGAVALADDGLRRRKVALVGGEDRAGEGQALLSPFHYLRRALATRADLIEGGLADVIAAAPDVIVLADRTALPDPEITALTEWTDAGGTLLRFAGPRMAASDRLADDPLLPVRLRPGGRDVGGALSWGEPRAVAPFAADGPFAGLTPPPDATVRAQLIAEPSPDLASRTLAALSDATPLVTRAALGQGQVVLFHTTANAEWTTLPLSGLFVQMLDRLVATARTQARETPAPEEDGYWTPETVLDGFGRSAVPDGLAPIPAADLAKGPGPGRPAGVYALADRRTALNAGTALTPATWPGAVIETPAGQGHDLMGLFLALAALALALDTLASMAVARGRLAFILIALMVAPQARAADTPIDAEVIRAADEVALAYVITGDAAVDEVSRQGLAGLSQVLAARTSVEPGAPLAVDLETQDISALVFLYWPVTATQAPPGPMAYARLNAFLRSGGMILFDTRDGDLAGTGGPTGSDALRTLAAPLEIPPLAPIPDDHVLTRSFYLLQGFLGRWDGPEVWAEAPPADAQVEGDAPFGTLNDGVTPVIIGGNAWAEAWALDDSGLPVFPVGRGWEGEDQREMAYRFGVNLIIYVLTGNYKSDQVHVPALLERLRGEERRP